MEVLWEVQYKGQIEGQTMSLSHTRNVMFKKWKALTKSDAN